MRKRNHKPFVYAAQSRGGSPMTAKETDDPLILARSLPRHAEQLCNGLESGTVDLYDLVTPTTAPLLHWWFLEDACHTRAFTFHPGPRPANPHTLEALEVLDTRDGGTPR